MQWSLALELAPRRIRVNAVSPGVTDTPAYGRLGVPAETVAAWGADVPLGRVGTPADVASYVTGDNLVVSAGLGIHARPT